MLLTGQLSRTYYLSSGFIARPPRKRGVHFARGSKSPRPNPTAVDAGLESTLSKGPSHADWAAEPPQKENAVARTTQQRRDVQSHLVLAILTLLPAVRCQNLADIKITKREGTDREQNVLLVDAGGGCTLILNSFKTSDSYGQQRLHFPPARCTIVQRSLWLFPRRYLISLLRSGNRAMGANMLFQFASRIFSPKRVGVTMLRKLWVSEFSRRRPSLEQKCALAASMLHSVDVAESNYLKHIEVL